MCGFAMIASVGTPTDARRWQASLDAMVGCLSHRGPDAQATWYGQGVALGHTRLAIIDLSVDANQPFVDHESGAVLAFNGEIYNYVELREELVRAGYRFRTHSDTEVLLRALLAWGPAAIARCVGMFAFAFHDPRDGTTLLVRDPFGIKPLYWLEDAGLLYVASEPAALLRAVPSASRLDQTVAARFLATGLVDVDDRTFYSPIKRLPAATGWKVSVGRPLSSSTPERYWAPPSAPASGPRRSWGDMVDEVRAALTDSVRLHLRSDVPVASCLSGGTDSSSLVALAARLRNADAPPLAAYSAVFPGEPIDESRYAQAVVERAGARWIKVTPTDETLAADFDALLDSQQEPFASTGVYLQWRLFQRIAADGVKVVLDGQGADEYLAGYTSFLVPSILDHLAAGRIGDAAATLGVLVHDKGLGQLLGRDLRGALVRVLGRDASAAADSSWLAPGMVHALADARTPAIVAASRLRRTGLAYLGRNSLPSLLRYEDRNSMHFSLESRVPFLDHRLVQTVLGLPDDALLQRGRTKAVLRDAMRGIVPDIVLDRRDKLGFASPIGKWVAQFAIPALRGSLGRAERIAPFVNPAVLRQWLAEEDGSRHTARVERLWRLFVLLRWQERTGTVA